MNIKTCFFLLLLSLLITSCGEDRTIEYKERIEANSWIYRTMADEYLYASLLAKESSTTQYAEPAFYASSLFSAQENRHGQKLSTFFWGRQAEELDYGLLYNFHTHDTIRYLRVLHVFPFSSAAEAGLQRGDWITAIDGVPLSSANSTILANTENALSRSLQLSEYVDTLKAGVPLLRPYRTVMLPAPRVRIPTAIEKDTVFNASERKIGYMLFTNLETSATGGEDFYGADAIRLRSIFRSFSQQDVNEIVLDLRFAYGQSLAIPYLTAAMLAPNEAIGQPFYYAVRNSNRETELSLLSASLIGEGARVPLERLYVLTSARTQGTAELLAHCLSPYMQVTLIGEKTAGQDQLAEIYHNAAYDYSLRLVTTIFFNAAEETYSSGLLPAIALSETNRLVWPMYPLGDPREALLKEALRCIHQTPADKPGISIP